MDTLRKGVKRIGCRATGSRGRGAGTPRRRQRRLLLSCIVVCRIYRVHVYIEYVHIHMSRCRFDAHTAYVYYIHVMILVGTCSL